MHKSVERDKALDFRQSPIGFFNLGLDYLTAADELTARQLDKHDPLRLVFDSPIKHLYAHGWELCLKACIFQQGILPSDMKREFGHKLSVSWDKIDKVKFAEFNLNPKTRQIVELLDELHPTKLFAYPITGVRQEWSLTFLKASSQRFKIPRATIYRIFGDSVHNLG